MFTSQNITQIIKKYHSTKYNIVYNIVKHHVIVYIVYKLWYFSAVAWTSLHFARNYFIMCAIYDCGLSETDADWRTSAFLQLIAAAWNVSFQGRVSDRFFSREPTEQGRSWTKVPLYLIMIEILCQYSTPHSRPVSGGAASTLHKLQIRRGYTSAKFQSILGF